MKAKKATKPKPKEIKQTIARPVFKPNIWLAVISAIFGLCLYLNTVGHQYVLDDVGTVTDNPNVMQGIKGIPRILTLDMWHFENLNLGYYRPLSLITFAFEHQFFPNSPRASHWGNVVLYGVTGFFLCLLLMSLFKHFHPLFAFIITLLFLAHPIHTEVVANIKSRDEILAFLNMVIGLYFLLKAYTSPKVSAGCIVASGIFFYLALLSKESAMTGLLIAPLLLFFGSNSTLKQSAIRAWPFALMILAFQVNKYVVLGSLSGKLPNDLVNYPYTAAGARLPTTFLIFLQSIKRVLLPHPLSYDYSYNQIPVGTFGSAGVYVGMLSALAIAWFSFRGLRNKSPLAFGCLFFCATIAPALAFVFLRGGIFAERFLYAPSLGFCIALVFLLVSITRAPFQSPGVTRQQLSALPGLFLPVLVMVALYSFKTVTRNRVWHDNLTLFATDVKASARSCQVRRHYGGELINMGMAEKDPQKQTEWFNKGIEQFSEGLKINPHFAEIFFKLGVAYQTVKVTNDLAIYYYNRAIQEAPGYAIPYNNLGILYENLGKQELASYYYNRAAEVNPFWSEGVRNRDNHKKQTGLDVRVLPASTNLDASVKY